MSLNYQTTTFQISQNQHFRREAGSRNPGTFNGKLPRRTYCSAKGTNKQHWTVRNRIFRIGVEPGSSNQRKEARGFSQVNAGLLFPRIRNRGQRIEDRGSRKRFRNNVLNLCNSREKAEGQRKAVSKEHSTPPTKES